MKGSAFLGRRLGRLAYGEDGWIDGGVDVLDAHETGEKDQDGCGKYAYLNRPHMTPSTMPKASK